MAKLGKRLTMEDLVLNIIVNSNTAQSEIGKLGRAMAEAKDKLAEVEREMRELERTGQTSSARYDKLREDVKRYNLVINASKSKLTALNQTMSLQDKSLKQLEQSLRRTRQLWRQATSDADRRRYAEEMELLNRRIAELRRGGEQTGSALQRASRGIQRYFAAIAAGAASLMAAFSGVKKATDEYARFDDVLADVMKTTNLTKAQAKELNAELEKIDSRTSQEDRLGLARIAGKLGYEDVAEIAGFVRANNQIIVALNEDLGGNVEETVNKIGKLVDIFSLKDMHGTEEAFLKVGSAINELGMASTANEGYMVEFARRMAGVAPLAGITIEQILGLGATLDQLGQTEEVASTALSKLFLDIAKNTGTYAKYAGMEVRQFSQLLEKDFMGAFAKVLHGVRNSSEGINALAATLGDLGQDGGRVIGVIGSLANNVDTLTGSIGLAEKAMKDGTSVTDEYNIKNDTAAARLERTRNEVARFWRELGEKLWPAISAGNSLLATFLRALTALIGFLAANIKWIAVLTAATVAYYTAVQVAARWEAITTAYMAAKRIVLATLGKAYALLTGKIKLATIAQRLLNIAALANPYALAAAALAALGSAIYSYNEKIRGVIKAQGHLQKAMKAAGDETAAETGKIASLNKVMTDTSQAQGRRLAALEQLRQIMPGVLDGYRQEELLAGKASAAIARHTDALLLNAQMKAKQQELDELAVKARKIARGEVGFWTAAYREGRKAFIGSAAATAADARDDAESMDNINKASKGLTESLITDQEKLNRMNRAGPDGSPRADPAAPPRDAGASEKARKEAFGKEIEAQEKHFRSLLQQHGLYRAQVADLAEEQLDKLLELEADNREKVDALHKKHGQATKETPQKAKEEIDRRKKQSEAYLDAILRQQQSETELENAAHQERMKKAGIFGKERGQMTERQLQAIEILERQHAANLGKIDAAAIKTEHDRLRAGHAAQMADMRTRHSEEIAAADTLEKARERLRATLSERELAQIKTLAQARKAIQGQQRTEQQAAAREHLEDLLRLLQTAARTGQWEGLQLSDSILSEEEKKVLEERIRAVMEELARLRAAGQPEEAPEGQMDTGRERASVDVLGMAAGDWERLFENIENGKAKLEDLYGVLNAGTELWGQYNKMVAARENQQLKADEEANKKKKENLKKRLDAGAMSQESYNKEVERMDAALDRKKAEIALAQARRERSTALMAAIVNTAKGVTAVFPNLILAALISAMGGLQIATIASTPLPSVEGREAGGALRVRRAQDGKVFYAKADPDKRGYVHAPTVIVGEDGTEWVASAQAVKNPTVRPVLDLLDTAQRNGTISTINLREAIAPPAAARRPLQGRQNGGYLAPTAERTNAPADPGDARIIDVLDRLDGTVARLEGRLAGLRAEVSLLGKNGFVEKMKELQDIQNSANL